MRETADELIHKRRIEPLIIAAVYHGGEKRIREYTPGRAGKLHGRMVVDELLPFLHERYRTLTQARHTGIGGSSLGGLSALWLGLEYPQVFGKLAVLSPSVWWGQRAILKYVQALQQPQRQRMWLDMGTAEGEKPFHSIRDARLLKALLVTKGWREGSTLHYSEVGGADHSERAWAARAPEMLEFLYPRKR